MVLALVSVVLAGCGDGRIDVEEQPTCAPCVAGAECPCGVISVPTEACDGKQLGGKSCVSLGFLGGTLSCTKACTVDTSQCRGASGLERAVTSGSFGALALSADLVATVTSTRQVLTLETFSRKTLEPVARTEQVLRTKADGAGGVGELRVARVPDGWVVAGQAYGSTSELSIWHVDEQGAWTARGVARGQRPLFLINAGDELALGGEAWASDSRSVGVVLTTLRADGTPGASRFLAAPDRIFTGNTASAAHFGGVVHVLSSCTPNQANRPVRLNGAPLDQLGAHGVLVADPRAGAHAVVVKDGLWRVTLGDDGEPRTAPTKLADGLHGPLHAAGVVGGELVVWAMRGTLLVRATAKPDGAASAVDMLSGMNLEVLAMTQAADAAFALANANGRTALHRF
jgi:hypothetical protein